MYQNNLISFRYPEIHFSSNIYVLEITLDTCTLQINKRATGTSRALKRESLAIKAALRKRARARASAIFDKYDKQRTAFNVECGVHRESRMQRAVHVGRARDAATRARAGV